MTKTIKSVSTTTLVLLVSLSMLVPLAFAAPSTVKVNDNVQTSAAQGLGYAPDEVLVKYKNDSVPFRVQKVNHGQTVSQAVSALSRNPNVEYAEPNYVVTALAFPDAPDDAPDDPFYDGYQWNFKDSFGGVYAESAWDITAGAGTIVAVVDTGVAYEDYVARKRGRVILEQYTQAPDLSGTCFVAGRDFVNNDNHPNDDEGHGTHVAGTIAQATNNGYGVAGLAYETCVMPVKVLDSNGSGYTSDVVYGIDYAVANGADVINLSLGGSGGATLEAAVANAYNAGVTVVAATGNNNGAVGYPAAYDDYVIAVGATDSSESRASFSNFGTSIDIVAPGVSILQQTFNQSPKNINAFDYLYYFSGTSMATPHVAAAAAMVISHGNATSPDDVRSALETSAKDLGAPNYDIYYGNGLLNIASALAWTAGPVGPIENIAPVAVVGNDYSLSDFDGNFTESVTLDSAGSHDPDGTIVDYSWSLNGVEFSTSTTTSVPLTLGATDISTSSTYLLTVEDNVGSSTSASVTVTLTANQVPAVSAVVDATVAVGSLTTFDGSASSDDGSTLIFAWDFGDGATDVSTSASVDYSYSATGTYSVTLVVTDEAGESDMTGTTIEVIEAPSITLSVSSSKSRGRYTSVLEWSGALGDTVDILYDESFHVNETNDDLYSESMPKGTSGTHYYQVCETVDNGGDCSSKITVTF